MIWDCKDFFWFFDREVLVVYVTGAMAFFRLAVFYIGDVKSLAL